MISILRERLKEKQDTIADQFTALYCCQSQGKDIADSELLHYISESSTMSKSLADYGQQKSCAVTTAKRLADFLGDTMVKDKGLLCQYIVASEPKVGHIYLVKFTSFTHLVSFANCHKILWTIKGPLFSSFWYKSSF